VIIALHMLSIKSSKGPGNKGFTAMCPSYPFIWTSKFMMKATVYGMSYLRKPLTFISYCDILTILKCNVSHWNWREVC